MENLTRLARVEKNIKIILYKLRELNKKIQDISVSVIDNLTSLSEILSTHTSDKNNPHSVTKAQIGLSNVDNTSDLNKPISTATQTALDSKQNAIGYTPENAANKATDFTSPDNTKYPTTLAVANENKKATITVELISQLTTNFYAPNALRINSTALISGSGTLTLKVNDVAYTLGNLIPQGAKITAETSSSSVYNLISIYE